MAISQPNTAEYRRFHTRPRALTNVSFSTTLFCLLVLLLIGCSPQPNTQTTTAGSQPIGQQQSSGQLTYVAIGASDTFGLGSDDPYTQNWASDLAALLGQHYRLINLGVPSITTHEALTVELPVALDSHPDLVTIWLAVNDIIDKVPTANYAHDLDMLLSHLQAAEPHVPIAVANVPDLTLLPYFYNQNTLDPQVVQAQIQAYNTAIAAIVSHHHVILVDLSQRSYDIQNHPEYISDDGLHPTDLGYVQLAHVFYQALQKVQQ